MKRAKWKAALLGTILRLANSQSGQAWAEYSLIIALVAVTAVTALAALGLAIADSFPEPFDGLLQALNKVKEQP